MAQYGMPVYNLRLLRTWRGLTQGQLAARLHCHLGTVSEWELGRAAPMPARLRALCGALGVSQPILMTPDPLTALTVARICDPWTVTATSHARWVALVTEIQQGK